MGSAATLGGEPDRASFVNDKAGIRNTDAQLDRYE